MSSKTKEDYNRKLDVIRSIGEKQLKQPHHIPVGIYIQEAETLYLWAQDDIDALTGVGLDRELVEDLPARCGALFEAEAAWQVCQKSRSENDREWKLQSPQAYKLRDRMLSDFRFAFRKEPDLLKTVTDIAKGTGHADMLQALNNLAVLGRQETELLAGTGFDMDLLEQAALASDELSSLLAIVTSARELLSEEKMIRDQAFTHLKEAVNEIYECGRHAFRNNKERLVGYRSRFLRQQRNKKPRPRKSNT
ncbi:MAG: hypothetical protein GY757_34595 [bacterium]|nr:hypothetical protein [bacterium]